MWVMKKRFLNKLNVFLGMLSLGLAGCHTVKQPVQCLYGPPPEPKKYGPPPEVVEKYGIPPELLDEPIDEGQIPEEPKPKYGVPTPPEDEPVKCLYGVPYPD